MTPRVRYALRAAGIRVVAQAVLTRSSIPFVVVALVTPRAGWWRLLLLLAALVIGTLSTAWAIVRPVKPLLPDNAFARAVPVEVEDVVLRLPTPSDATALGETIDDKVVRANGLPKSNARGTRALCQVPQVAAEQGLFVICAAADNRVLGAVTSHNYDAATRTLHAGIWLGPTSRGRGYATQALRAAAQLAAQAGISGVHLGTNVDNRPMVRAFEASGATFVREARHKLPNGEEVVASWWLLPPPRL